MPFNITIELRKEYIYALVEGEYDFPSFLKTTDVIMEACEKYQVTKILADFRKVTGVQDPMERFQHAEAGTRKYLDLLAAGKIKHSRFAYLGNYPQIDPGKFGETVAVNRGMTVKATTSLKEAFEWLLVERDME